MPARCNTAIHGDKRGKLRAQTAEFSIYLSKFDIIERVRLIKMNDGIYIMPTVSGEKSASRPSYCTPFFTRDTDCAARDVAPAIDIDRRMYHTPTQSYMQTRQTTHTPMFRAGSKDARDIPSPPLVVHVVMSAQKYYSFQQNLPLSPSAPTKEKKTKTDQLRTWFGKRPVRPTRGRNASRNLRYI